jgi:hypothetical protein
MVKYYKLTKEDQQLVDAAMNAHMIYAVVAPVYTIQIDDPDWPIRVDILSVSLIEPTNVSVNHMVVDLADIRYEDIHHERTS